MEVFSVFHPHRPQLRLVVLDIRLQLLAVPLPRPVRLLDHLIVGGLTDVELEISSELMLHAFPEAVAKSTLGPAIALRVACRPKAAAQVMAAIGLPNRHPFTAGEALAALSVWRMHVPDVQAKDPVQLLL